jgi:protein-S-isoprenylcysteine O-methyltransferase Ste14
MENREITFRVISFIALCGVGFARDLSAHYYSRLIKYVRSKPRRPVHEILAEILASNQENLLTLVPVAIAGGLTFAGIFAYIGDPNLIAWGRIEIPIEVRWVGVVILGMGALGEVWVLRYLGEAYSPILRVTKARVLATEGPYGWVRHPLYSFALPFMLGFVLVAASAFILIGLAGLIVAVPMRARAEEAILLREFGDRYRSYMARTGRFFPRLRSG